MKYEPIENIRERPENEIDAYGIYEEILSKDKCAICKTRKEICFTEEDAEWKIKMTALHYEAYDSGYTRAFINHGRSYTKDGVEVRLYWKEITLIVKE